ncbi:MAG: tryptophan--tRNA ligase [bacterium]
MSKKVLLSGVKPTGLCHIGNYFGAMKQFVDLSENYESYIFIADYHALNLIQNKEEMKKAILGVLLDYLAIGLDPKKVVIFKQSDISELTELAWIFDTIVTVPYLMRAHAFKDIISKGRVERYKDQAYLSYVGEGISEEVKNQRIEEDILSGVNVGTFNYPMLMAADILLYGPDIVPVGQDQKQHVEYARDTAQKFNKIFGETFKLPEPMIMKDVAVVPGLDGKKMSKSYGNTIPLFAEYDEIKKCVMKIVTDSGNDIPENVFAIHKLLRSEEELKKIYEEKKGKYKEMKDLLVEDLEKFIAPMRERRKELEKDIPKVLGILKEGSEKAKKIANIKMTEVREKVGVSL